MTLKTIECHVLLVGYTVYINVDINTININLDREIDRTLWDTAGTLGNILASENHKT